MQFNGKVALVTGGNSGIGRGIVQRFAREGAAVALVGRDPAKGNAVGYALRGVQRTDVLLPMCPGWTGLDRRAVVAQVKSC